MRNPLKTLAIGTLTVIVATIVVGCLPYPLGDPAKSQIDPKLAGYWLNTGDDGGELVALFPFDDHTYVVEDLKLKKVDDKLQPDGPATVYKGWLTTIKDARFLTLDPVQQHLPTGSPEQKVYPALRLTVEAKDIVARAISDSADVIKAVKNAAELQAVVTKELNNPDIYSGEGNKFRHLDPDRDADTIQFLTKS